MERKEAILLVEDSEMQRETARSILEDLGYKRVIEAKDGQEALQALQKEKFDLILSDLEMPKMDGQELLQKIRSNPDYKDIPFIMLTIYDEKEKIVRAAGAGVSDYIIKPIERNTLKTRLKKIFGDA